MKKRIISLMLVVAMLAMTLIGCGETTDTTNTTNNDTNVETTDTTNTTNEPNIETNTEVDEPIEDVVTDVPTDIPTEEPIETPSVDEPTEDVVVEDGEDYPFSYESTWVFPEGMTGETEKYVFANDETWSLNYTHYVSNDGNEMNFLWEGPTALGEQAWSGPSTLVLSDVSRTYLTYAWSSPLDNMDGAIKYYDKETIVTVDSNTIYNDGDYYELYDEMTYDKVIFKVTCVVNDVEYIGYAIYMDDYQTMTTYQFNYLERSDVYDDTRALKIANSIDFWKEYVPQQ